MLIGEIEALLGRARASLGWISPWWGPLRCRCKPAKLWGVLKLATILDNPGEPLAETRYRDPAALRGLGYNALALYETVGLSGLESPDAVANPEMRRWVAQQEELIRARIAQARSGGLDVYLVYDVLTLARDTVSRHVGAYACKGRPTMLCPASEPALNHSAVALEALMDRLGGREIAGVVLRFGDNDALRLPYLLGNDIYVPHCARCAALGRADRIAAVLERFHALVVTRLNKRLVARAWNVRPDGMHDSVELCRRVARRLPGEEADDRLVLSFKFSHTDFWRYQRWNPASLEFGRRPIMYELECQREYEGKGGIVNWQVPLWRDGPPEAPPEAGHVQAHGLYEAAQRVNLRGLWAWVRGGGWGGPFVKNEAWIDANVFAVPLLADNPGASPSDLGTRWIRERLGASEPAVVEAVQQILEHSPSVVLKGFYIAPYARGRARPWHPNADWIQDDLIDAQAAWRIVQQMPESLLDDAVREKQEASDHASHDRAVLQQVMNEQNRKLLEPLLDTLVYAESLFETLRDLIAGLAAYRRFHRHKDAANAELARQRLLMAQSHWQHHTQRHGSLPGAATAFREAHFWELTQQMLSEVQSSRG